MRGDVWTYQCDTTRSTVEFSDGNRIQTVRHERADDGKTYSASMKVTLIKSGMREPPPGVEIADQPVRCCTERCSPGGQTRAERRLGVRGPHQGSATLRDRWLSPAQPRGKVVPGPTDVGESTCGVVRGLRDRLPGSEAERFGMGPAVVPGQDLTEVAGAVRDGAVADLAAGDRKMGNGHRETAAM